MRNGWVVRWKAYVGSGLVVEEWVAKEQEERRYHLPFVWRLWKGGYVSHVHSRRYRSVDAPDKLPAEGMEWRTVGEEVC